MISYDVLNALYENLYTRMTIDKKVKNNSILLSFLSITSNSRFRFLSESADQINCNEEELISYVKKNLIRPTNELGHYTITAKGIWEIEKGKNLSEEDIINFIDTKYFKIGDSGISDKEKVIILSFLTARAFSLNTAVDLLKDEYTLDSFKRIIDTCYQLLIENCLIKKIDNLYGGKGNEHTIHNLIWHTDPLPKKTKGIYKAAGAKKYFLDIVDDEKPDHERLCFLLGCIFTDNCSIKYEAVLDIYKVCTQTAYNEAPYLYDNISSTYVIPEYDDLIRNEFVNAFEQCIYLQTSL